MTIKTFVIILFSIILICVTVCWVYSKPSYETVIAFLTALIGFFVYYFHNNQKGFNKFDNDLFQQLLTIIPTQGAIEYLSSTDMERPIETKIINSLMSFSNVWIGAEYKFRDRKIERAKTNLIIAINDFFAEFNVNTYPRIDGRNEIPIEWSEDSPEKYNQIRDILNKLADQVVIAHAELIRVAKKNINI